jgi:hypothetical protein
VPVGLARARFCSWARWAGIFIEKNMYYSKYSIFTHNLLISKCLGRREWVDGVASDDDFPIRQALLVGVQLWCWARFSIENLYIIIDTIHMHGSYLFPWLRGGRTG